MGGSRLRLLLAGVNYAPEPTGIAPYTTGVAEGLARAGHEVHVLTTFPHYPQWAYVGVPPRRSTEVLNGVRVHRVRHYVPGTPSTWDRAAFELMHGSRVSSRRWPAVDVVVLVSPALFASRIAHIRARLSLSRPAVGLVIQDLYSQGLVESGGKAGRVAEAMRRIEGSAARAADGVAVIHKRFKDRVVDSLGVPAEKVAVLRNWSHVEPAEPFDVPAFRRTMGWRADETVVLHAGAMGAKQGLENVVDAARVAEERGMTIRFVLLGDGNQRAALEARSNGARQLQFVRPLDDEGFRRALAAADVLLVNERPSALEMAVPSKLTSYFTAKRPVLAATDAMSTTSYEVMAAGAGICVEPGRPDALVQAAWELGRDKELATALGARGYEYSQTVLSRETAISAYERWVRHLAVIKERGRS